VASSGITIISENPSRTKKMGKRLASRLKGGEVLAFFGDLGAGKTTFIKGLINWFLPGRRVISPTFIIVRQYWPVRTKVSQIIHADLYRLEKIPEIEDLGLTDFYNNPGAVLLIEWAGKIQGFLPEKRLELHFDVKEDNSRIITIKHMNQFPHLKNIF